MFAISKSPQGYASAAFSVQLRRKKSGCHFCELATLERRGGDDATSRAPTVGLGAFRGWLQGSPAPRQMCLGVTSHPRKNESPDRCWTSRPGCHASHARTRPAATGAGVRRSCWQEQRFDLCTQAKHTHKKAMWLMISSCNDCLFRQDFLQMYHSQSSLFCLPKGYFFL